ncbi:MAG: hypothetical protein OXE82_06965 [Rhodobacter sp.]|nr:hypothetical protein [Rhodobacter sp.]
MTKTMPGAAGDLAEAHPDVWSAYAALGKASSEAGPLNQIALLAIGPLGLPRGVAAKTWIKDVKD